jgi:RES domain-containing protein
LGGSNELVAWRLDSRKHAPTWDSGEGAYLAGGRWNSKGLRAVYCALDPATAMLEVAVHKGFRALDTVPHVMTEIAISGADNVHIVKPTDIPSSDWLSSGIPSVGQQTFGDALLAAHKFIVIPSVVSRQSWNLIFVATAAAGAYAVKSQERFALDPRLHPDLP